MSEKRRRHVKALYTFDAVVQRVPIEAWDNPSPCERWSARQIVSHLVYILPLWTGLDAPSGGELDQADRDPVGVWASSLDEHLELIDSEARLPEVVATNMGPLPLEESLGVLMVDPLLHAWDLAKAAQVAVHLPPQLCEVAHETLVFGREVIGSMFEPELPGPGNDIEGRLLRLSGRDPHWQASD